MIARTLLRTSLSAACALSLSLVAACGTELFQPTKGRVALSVVWPTNRGNFRILAIPPQTAKIVISIRGEGITDGQPLQVTLTPEGNKPTEFLDVPIGPKLVEAIALDADGLPLALAQEAIAVQPNALKEVTLTLKEIPPEITPTPVPTPTASATATPGGSPTPSVGPTATPSIERPLLIETIAGDGVTGFNDNRDALVARFNNPRSLAYDLERQALYVADTQYRLIRRLDLATGAVTTFGGRQMPNGQEPAGIPAALAGASPGVPSGLAIAPNGDLYFCDRENHMIRKISLADGRYGDVAGTGKAGYTDGPAGQAQFNYPNDLSIDRFGNVYVADTHNNRIRRITGTTVTTVVGAGATLGSQNAGMKLPAPTLDMPNAIAVAPGGRRVYIAEANAHRVSVYDLDKGTVELLAGTGRLGYEGEDGPATLADLALPTALAVDADGGLLIADGWGLKTGALDLSGAASRVLRVTQDQRLVRVAGVITPVGDYGGDGGDARKARLSNPSGLAIDATGRIFVADAFNNRIRLVRPAPVAPATPSPTPSATPTTTPAPEATATATPLPEPSAATGSSAPDPSSAPATRATTN